MYIDMENKCTGCVLITRRKPSAVMNIQITNNIKIMLYIVRYRKELMITKRESRINSRKCCKINEKEDDTPEQIGDEVLTAITPSQVVV